MYNNNYNYLEIEKQSNLLSNTFSDEYEHKLKNIGVVEVKHGKWLCNIDFLIMQAMIRCSLCDEPSITMSKFCPNCGAKMDLEEEDDGEGSN